ncbi:MAG: Hsp20/alpha crystallin family protein [Planctomycetes bacterium]|nr:Hsp20/alpha crystallin family protein [Planctomycetota bacterium]
MYMIPLRRSLEYRPPRYHDMVTAVFDNWFGQALTDGRAREWAPAIDVTQNDEAFVITAEVPGLSADDIKLSAEDNTLTIAGEKKDSQEHREQNHCIVERRFGSFERKISLPSDIDSDNIQAECKDGVLTVMLGKAAGAKVIHVPVRGQ